MRAAAIASPAMPAPAMTKMSWSANGAPCLPAVLFAKVLEDAMHFVISVLLQSSGLQR